MRMIPKVYASIKSCIMMLPNSIENRITSGMKLNINELKALLDEENLSITQFAADAGLHPQTIYNALWGKRLQKQSLGKLQNATMRLKVKNGQSKAAG